MTDAISQVGLCEAFIEDVLIIDNGTIADVVGRREDGHIVVNRRRVFAGCWETIQGVCNGILDALLVCRGEPEFGQSQAPSYEAS